MKYTVAIIILFIFLIGCKKEYHYYFELPVHEKFECSKGQMKSSWYIYGREESIPDIKDLPDAFAVVVDTNLSTSNFVSAEEDEAWELSQRLDTFYVRGETTYDDWQSLTDEQKLERVRTKRALFKGKAEYLHKANNTHQQVWLINNTKDTIAISVLSKSYMCIMQALSPHGQWFPIEFKRIYGCSVGTDFFIRGMNIPPHKANSFVFKIPNEGDYTTKLRFKVLGSERYYYSNEFKGTINYCQFVKAILPDNSSMMANDHAFNEFIPFPEALTPPLYYPYSK